MGWGARRETRTIRRLLVSLDRLPAYHAYCLLLKESMQRTFRWIHVRAAFRRSVVLLVASLLGTASLWAYPEKGTPAPPLALTQLLQAPSGARADWASLKGKVVVLEFWATWCAPCVASIPHLNELVASLDPAKFQFISIDDEDPKVIQAFLASKKMAGWVGIDTSGGVLAWYGVKSWPTTIVIDGNGKIVAATEIDSVSAADLRAVAEGKSVAFKPATEMVTSSAPSGMDAATHPLFAVSLSKAAPDAKFTRVNHPPTGTDLLGVDADSLVTEAFDITADRYVLAGTLPDGLYDLRVNFVDAPNSGTTSVVQQAILSGLHLQVQPKTVSRSVYVLRAAGAGRKPPGPPASAHKRMRGYWHGRYVLINGTMDDLAYVLATGLENPVVNETGIEGRFDARFQFAGRDLESLNAILKDTLGLELVQGDQVMSITVHEVSNRVENEAAPATKTEAPKP
jgi:uncharacterized protein (TIGR03435 family)